VRRCKTTDLFPLASSRTITSEGFLDASAKIARTGIQVYSARELGLDGGDKRIRLYRSPEEVSKSVKSFESKTATNDHPTDDVSSLTWKDVAVGDVRDVAFAGDVVNARIIVRDESAKQAVQDGKAEISCGYSFALDMTPGRTADGQEFDGWQRDIEGNHVAIVDAGRAGPAVRIADRDPNRSNLMKTRISTKDHKINDKLTVPGQTITIEAEEPVIKLVQDMADAHDRGMKICGDAYDSKHAEMLIHKGRAEDAEKALKEMAKASEDKGADEPDEDDDEVTDKKKAGDRILRLTKKVSDKLAAKDAEIARLTALTAPAEQEKLAEVRAKVIGDAKPFLAEDYAPKGKTVAQIRTAAVDAALKDEALAPVIKAIIGDGELAKAKAEDVTKAFDAIAALHGRVTTDDQDEVLSREILGNPAPISPGGGGASTVSGRDSFYAREAAMSRRQPTGAGSSGPASRDFGDLRD
jgi:hypothetical protein